ncbi:amino acid carrier protein [Corallincola luteus]|uniref:Amino acid carrier protein n=4 Tax=Psychromonadaceae TaxID=267894 RepID=A0A368NIM1_9GAMM|nr:MULTISPECIES: AGCS family amino acid carrier protein [Corallincola]RCU50412.1 amino acid carrier protein [Corallincola holothuriorum]TAA48577.1 amino acid carrier protein [Corallincola spongiicola]TCI05564.1 amino acid carrier protein [Corallincola luteus]
MQGLNDFLLMLDGFLGSAAWFPFVLLGVGLFFTVYLKFPQIRYFGHAWKVVRGKYDIKSAMGDTTHFQALTTALSGTVGTGNIGGVALAIHIGGPAALFWMWATAFFGMTTKFVEVTLSHKYRVKTADGTMAGGPMYYMDRRLNMKWLAVIFAIATVISSFGTGNLPQINNIASSMESTFGLEPLLTGGVLTVLLALVILGGIHRIAKVTSRIVPLMAFIYVIGALAVIFYNYQNILPSLVSVFSDAFSGSAAAGGFLGASFAYAFNKGVGRGLFSNEAGQGSAPIAHAAAKADEPVSEGIVSILEPFIDTIIVCTLTGLVILSSGVWTEKHQNSFQTADMRYLSGQYTDTAEADRVALSSFLIGSNEAKVEPYTGSVTVKDGVAIAPEYTLINAHSVAEDVIYLVGGHPYSGEMKIEKGKLVNSELEVTGRSLLHSAALTTKAFTKGFFGDYGKYIVSIGLLLFAFSTAIAWSYYGDRAVTYLLGVKAVMPYRVFYCAGFLWAAVADTTVVWNLAAVAIVLMTLPNLFGIMILCREMKTTVADYWTDFYQQRSERKD